jgi:hypothetical protein
MSSLRVVLAGTVLAAVLAACGSEGAGTATSTFPQHGGFGFAGPSGRTAGTLISQDGCLMYEASDDGAERTLLVWPTGFAPLSDGQGVQGDGHTLLVGDSVVLGGGEYTDETWVWERLVGPPIAAACRTGRYALVTSVVSVSSPER